MHSQNGSFFVNSSVLTIKDILFLVIAARLDEGLSKFSVPHPKQNNTLVDSELRIELVVFLFRVKVPVSSQSGMSMSEPRMKNDDPASEIKLVTVSIKNL